MGGVRSSRRLPLRNGFWSTKTMYTPSDLMSGGGRGRVEKVGMEQERVGREEMAGGGRREVGMEQEKECQFTQQR